MAPIRTDTALRLDFSVAIPMYYCISYVACWCALVFCRVDYPTSGTINMECVGGY